MQTIITAIYVAALGTAVPVAMHSDDISIQDFSEPSRSSVQLTSNCPGSVIKLTGTITYPEHPSIRLTVGNIVVNLLPTVIVELAKYKRLIGGAVMCGANSTAVVNLYGETKGPKSAFRYISLRLDKNNIIRFSAMDVVQ